MKPDASVLSVMTPFPVHATAKTTLIAAQSMMKGHDIRHLPVQDDGRLIGVVSQRDLHIAGALLDNPDLPLARLCTRDPLTVESDRTLKQAVLAMADRGVDAALVMRQGRLVGILTLSDIAGVLLRLLPGPPPTLPTSGGDGVA
jgi:acetoin utilization protein AcuB